MARRLALGFDFGTESVRAMLVDCRSGTIAGQGTAPYRHGVMDQCYGAARHPLPADFALQAAQDYLEALTAAATAARDAAQAAAAEVVGIGVDFTACTMLPVDQSGVPLSAQPRFRDQPHAAVKLWKHHGAIREAAAINELAAARREPWLARYGGTTSSEWLLAKAFETLHQAPEVYAAADRFLEASDWVVWQLGGRMVRGACAAGYKGLWLGGEKWVGEAFLAALDPRLEKFFSEKARGPIQPAGTVAGTLTPEWAARLGLAAGTPISAAIIDAHAAVPGCGVMDAGELVIILGTSSCHMLLSRSEVLVAGIQGVVQDGVLPGFFGYEAGQAATGDMVDWWVERMLGQRGEATAPAHQELSQEAARIPAGGTGLLVLDWWNGNRSILIDPELTGLVVGLTRSTRPADLYRALIEGAAFGTRKILENFTAHGLAVERITVCGGIAEKNPLWLQIYADVTGRPLTLAAAPQVCALGAAILGAVAAGAERGGHASLEEAVAAMVPPSTRHIQPVPGNHKLYQTLGRHWNALHEQFGVRDPALMKFLRSLRPS